MQFVIIKTYRYSIYTIYDGPIKFHCGWWSTCRDRHKNMFRGLLLNWVRNWAKYQVRWCCSINYLMMMKQKSGIQCPKLWRVHLQDGVLPWWEFKELEAIRAVDIEAIFWILEGKYGSDQKDFSTHFNPHLFNATGWTLVLRAFVHEDARSIAVFGRIIELLNCFRKHFSLNQLRWTNSLNNLWRMN